MINPNFMMKNMFFGMFGGGEKFDCWLTQTAEILANVNDPRVKPIKLDTNIFPPMAQNLMHKPHEVVDNFLEMLEGFNTWEYQVRTKGELAQVIDILTGHVIEEGNEKELLEKYKVN